MTWHLRYELLWHDAIASAALGVCLRPAQGLPKWLCPEDRPPRVVATIPMPHPRCGPLLVVEPDWDAPAFTEARYAVIQVAQGNDGRPQWLMGLLHVDRIAEVEM